MKLFDKLLQEATEWNYGNTYDGALEYALNNGYDVVAVFLWDSSGASQLEYKKCPVTFKEFKVALKDFHAETDTFICKSCNHHGIYDKGEYATINWCMSCNDESVKLPE